MSEEQTLPHVFSDQWAASGASIVAAEARTPDAFSERRLSTPPSADSLGARCSTEGRAEARTPDDAGFSEDEDYDVADDADEEDEEEDDDDDDDDLDDDEDEKDEGLDDEDDEDDEDEDDEDADEDLGDDDEDEDEEEEEEA